jgi:hypothetical protein
VSDQHASCCLLGQQFLTVSAGVPPPPKTLAFFRVDSVAQTLAIGARAPRLAGAQAAAVLGCVGEFVPTCSGWRIADSVRQPCDHVIVVGVGCQSLIEAR